MKRRHAAIGIKCAVDRIMAPVLLVLLVPLLAVIALAIKIEDGHSVFYRQQRTGLRGRPYRIWKFRTMIPDADALLDEQGGGGRLDRITKIGKILRVLSLDELPQLINITKGDMSFIGPRAALCEHLRRYTEEQRRRLSMKPGITGLAQVNGRNTLKWSERIEYDLWYVDHYSMWLDLKILAKTIRVVIRREGIALDRRPEICDDLGRKAGGQE